VSGTCISFTGVQREMALKSFLGLRWSIRWRWGVDRIRAQSGTIRVHHFGFVSLEWLIAPTEE
jgi:hypothetical protein